jgi:hypothetical protein
MCKFIFREYKLKVANLLFVRTFLQNANMHTNKYSMKDVSKCISNISQSGSTIFTSIDLTAPPHNNSPSQGSPLNPLSPDPVPNPPPISSHKTLMWTAYMKKSLLSLLTMTSPSMPTCSFIPTHLTPAFTLLPLCQQPALDPNQCH